MKKTAITLALIVSSVCLGQQNSTTIHPSPSKINIQSYSAQEDLGLSDIVKKQFEGEEKEKYLDIIENPHFLKQLNLKAKNMSKEEFESYVISDDFSKLTNMSHIALKEENYTSEYLGNKLNLVKIRKKDMHFDVKVKLVYEDSKKDLDVHTLVYTGTVRKDDYWNITGIGIVKYNMHPKDKDVEFYIRTYARAHNIFTSWFGLYCDTDPVADSTMKSIQTDIDRIVEYHNNEL